MIVVNSPVPSPNTSAVRQATSVWLGSAAGTKAPGPVAYQAIKDAGAGFMQRGGTTAYPHLTLGAGQRFASKGLYFVHYDAAGGVVAEGDWIVP